MRALTRARQRAGRRDRVSNQINRLELEIDEAVAALLAKRQTVASTEMITTAQIVTDLESIGDACGPSRRVVGSKEPTMSLRDLPRMAETGKAMGATHSMHS